MTLPELLEWLVKNQPEFTNPQNWGLPGSFPSSADRLISSTVLIQLCAELESACITPTVVDTLVRSFDLNDSGTFTYSAAVSLGCIGILRAQQCLSAILASRFWLQALDSIEVLASRHSVLPVMPQLLVDKLYQADNNWIQIAQIFESMGLQGRNPEAESIFLSQVIRNPSGSRSRHPIVDEHERDAQAARTLLAIQSTRLAEITSWIESCLRVSKQNAALRDKCLRVLKLMGHSICSSIIIDILSNDLWESIKRNDWLEFKTITETLAAIGPRAASSTIVSLLQNVLLQYRIHFAIDSAYTLASINPTALTRRSLKWLLTANPVGLMPRELLQNRSDMGELLSEMHQEGLLDALDTFNLSLLFRKAGAESSFVKSDLHSSIKNYFIDKLQCEIDSSSNSVNIENSWCDALLALANTSEEIPKRLLLNRTASLLNSTHWFIEERCGEIMIDLAKVINASDIEYLIDRYGGGTTQPFFESIRQTFENIAFFFLTTQRPESPPEELSYSVKILAIDHLKRCPLPLP